MSHLTVSDMLGLWRRVLIKSVRSGEPDLSSRQMAILLSVYLTPPPHTVRGLAAQLGVAKPVITRALDTLGVMGYLKRKRDKQDRRNVFIQRTVKGAVFLSDYKEMIVEASARPSDAADTDPTA